MLQSLRRGRFIVTRAALCLRVLSTTAHRLVSLPVNGKKQICGYYVRAAVRVRDKVKTKIRMLGLELRLGIALGDG